MLKFASPERRVGETLHVANNTPLSNVFSNHFLTTSGNDLAQTKKGVTFYVTAL